MKKSVKALLLVAMTVTALAGCSSKSADPTTAATEAVTTTAADSAADTTADTTAAEGAATEDGKSYTIGIGQFAEHGSLDNCREGFLQGLADEGIVEGQNLTIHLQKSRFNLRHCDSDCTGCLRRSEERQRTCHLHGCNRSGCRGACKRRRNTCRRSNRHQRQASGREAVRDDPEDSSGREEDRHSLQHQRSKLRNRHRRIQGLSSGLRILDFGRLRNLHRL